MGRNTPTGIGWRNEQEADPAGDGVALEDAEEGVGEQRAAGLKLSYRLDYPNYKTPEEEGPSDRSLCSLGYSVYKYRPFTLEGNFAAVQAVNEMLLQTINGTIHVGYALPVGISAFFDQLRTEGGFLVSADIDARGALEGVRIHSTVGGLCRMANPWPDKGVVITSSRSRRTRGAILTFETDAGTKYRLSPVEKTAGASRIKNPTRT